MGRRIGLHLGFHINWLGSVAGANWGITPTLETDQQRSALVGVLFCNHLAWKQIDCAKHGALIVVCTTQGIGEAVVIVLQALSQGLEWDGRSCWFENVGVSLQGAVSQAIRAYMDCTK